VCVSFDWQRRRTSTQNENENENENEEWQHTEILNAQGFEQIELPAKLLELMILWSNKNTINQWEGMGWLQVVGSLKW